MPALQRRISRRGPRFFREGDELMFVHHLDGSTQIGPRAATEEDKAEHAQVWGEFLSQREKKEPAREAGGKARG